MKIRLAAAFAVACLFVAPIPAYAQACQFTLPVTVADLEARGTAHKVLTAEERVAFLVVLVEAHKARTGEVIDFSVVTDVVLAMIGDEVYFAVVIDGCLEGPYLLAMFLPEEKKGGWTPTGVSA